MDGHSKILLRIVVFHGKKLKSLEIVFCYQNRSSDREKTFEIRGCRPKIF